MLISEYWDFWWHSIIVLHSSQCEGVWHLCCNQCWNTGMVLLLLGRLTQSQGLFCSQVLHQDLGGGRADPQWAKGQVNLRAGGRWGAVAVMSFAFPIPLCVMGVLSTSPWKAGNEFLLCSGQLLLHLLNSLYLHCGFSLLFSNCPPGPTLGVGNEWPLCGALLLAGVKS